MLRHKIDGVRSVVVTDDAVYANLDEDFDGSGLVLVMDSWEVPFEPHAITVGRRFDFDESRNLNVRVEGKKGVSVNPAPHIFLNQIADWYVPGFSTLQICFAAEAPSHRLTFPEQLVVKGGIETLVFNAKIANHRAQADLVVKFTDLDTGAEEVCRAKFDPAFLGGRTPDTFQDVNISVPKHFSNVAVEVSIDYLRCTDDRFGDAYVFVFDMHVVEKGLDFYDTDQGHPEGRWVRAKLPASLDGLGYAFVDSGKETTVLLSKAVEVTQHFFDADFYVSRNTDLDPSRIDAFSHYLLRGWKEFRNPNPEFSVREYLLRHPDVEAAGAEPLIHYANVGKAQNFSIGSFEEKLHEIWNSSGKSIPSLDASTILRRAQDMMVPMSIIGSRKMAVFVVPEHNAMSGGIYSFFSIADHARRMRRLHGYDVLVMTRPNPQQITYVRLSAFRNCETVLRFEQLRLFSEIAELQIHIPEYATVDFVRNLSPELVRYLLRRDSVHINILNQNTRLMREPQMFRDLRRIASSIGQSVSHHAFFGQEFADYYNLPTILLPAYTDLSAYPPVDFEEKEKIILFSDDDARYRRAVLKRLEQLDDYRLVKVKDMTFDAYMDLATRCKFSISFGEGFDGYVAQPIYQGGIGLALYNKEFFPDSSYADFENFFQTEEEMIEQIVPTIRRLEADRERYVALNKALRAKWDEIYSYEDYVKRVVKLMRREYEIFPKGSVAP